MQNTPIGLYYPYIHFQDEHWLKRATLYWDKMGRIVPDMDDVDAEDTDFVRALKNDLGFVEDLHPRNETPEVGLKFLELLHRHEPELRARYGSAKWKDRLKVEGPDKNRRHGDSVIEQVYSEKMSKPLREALVDTKLAFAPKHKDTLIMHRKLADVYMTVLAASMAKGRYEPTSDTVENHFAVMGGSIEHIKQALIPLKARQPSNVTPEQETASIAMFALKMTVPKNMDEVSLDQIATFRKRHREEVIKFRKDVISFAEDQDLLRSIIKQPAKLQTALENAYNKKVQKKLEGFDDIIRDTWKETAFAMLYVSPMSLVVKGLPALTGAVESISVSIAAVALGTIPMLRKNQRDLKAKVGPEAYLIHAKEYFEPAVGRVTRMKRWTRNFFFRV
jgi:hypothetical protein